MGNVRPYTADEDRELLRRIDDENWTFQKTAFRLGRSADGVAKRYHRLKESGVDRAHLAKLHRLAIGFRV